MPARSALVVPLAALILGIASAAYAHSLHRDHRHNAAIAYRHCGATLERASSEDVARPSATASYDGYINSEGEYIASPYDAGPGSD
ncbi:MAG: hypothetical protein P4L68_06695 [Methylovirgula sp.]|nr:hypothetical protein [Methylovirgula sp.]